MPGVPYAQLIGLAVALGLVVAVVWTAYRWGVNAERGRQSRAALKLDQEVRDAVDAGRRDPVRVDDDFLHKRSDPPAR